MFADLTKTMKILHLSIRTDLISDFAFTRAFFKNDHFQIDSEIS